MRILIISLLLLNIAGCATVGNPKIKDVTPEMLKHMTKDQLFAEYGQPNTKQLIIKDDKEIETYTWSYATVAPGHVESAAFSVSFDGENRVSTITVNRTPVQ
jgi:hypothetical protein